MARLAVPLFLYAETPLHPGTGAHLGAVDLPVQRERHTGYPIIQGSSLKGVFRSTAGEMGWDPKEIEAIFGPETEEADKHAGAVSFTDARILLFPVRALGTVFAWTTCPDVLARLRRDLAQTGLDGLLDVPTLPDPKDGALVPPNSALIEGGKPTGLIVLEEFSYSAKTDSGIKALGEWLGRYLLPGDQAYAFWKTKLAADLILLSDSEFREFSQMATEVVTRVRLKKETKTVESGGLWTEEHVPSDSAFYALILVQDPTVENKPPEWTADWVARRFRTFDGRRIQVGGDETTGRGFAVARFGGGDDGKNR